MQDENFSSASRHCRDYVLSDIEQLFVADLLLGRGRPWASELSVDIKYINRSSSAFRIAGAKIVQREVPKCCEQQWSQFFRRFIGISTPYGQERVLHQVLSIIGVSDPESTQPHELFEKVSMELHKRCRSLDFSASIRPRLVEFARSCISNGTNKLRSLITSQSRGSSGCGSNNAFQFLPAFRHWTPNTFRLGLNARKKADPRSSPNVRFKKIPFIDVYFKSTSGSRQNLKCTLWKHSL